LRGGSPERPVHDPVIAEPPPKLAFQPMGKSF
jgi:hypothetical protein